MYGERQAIEKMHVRESYEILHPIFRRTKKLILLKLFFLKHC